MFFFIKKYYVDIITIFSNIDILILIYSCFLYILLIFFAAFLWSNIVQEIGVDLDWKKNSNIYLSTLAARRLPGSIIHIIGRVGMYKFYGQSVKRIALASALEYLLIIFSGIVLTILFIPLFIRNFYPFWFLLFLVMIILLFLIRSKSFEKLLHKIKGDESLPRINNKKIIFWLIGYSVIWVLGGFLLLLIIHSIDLDSKIIWYQSVFSWVSSGVIGMIITFLPSGLGVVEVSLSSSLSKIIGIPVAISVALLSRIIQTLMDIVISMIFLLLNKVFNPKELLK